MEAIKTLKGGLVFVGGCGEAVDGRMGWMYADPMSKRYATVNFCFLGMCNFQTVRALIYDLVGKFAQGPKS